MPSQSLLQIVGSRGRKEAHYAPIFTDRFFVGLWTNRNPLRSPLSTFYADGWHLGGTDALISGLNVELSPRLTLCRRPGNVPYSTATVPLNPLGFYSFFQFGSSTVTTIVDTSGAVYTLTPTTLTSIFTKSPGAVQANFLGIGETLYFGDGVEVKAWQNNAIRNWGISIGLFSNAIGPNTAGAGADGGGSNVWANPGDVTGSSGYATASATALKDQPYTIGYTNALNATAFGFSIPVQEVISGITVTLAGFYAITSGTLNASLQAQLLKNGSPVGNPIQISPTTSSSTLTFGGPANLWGTTFSANDLNSSTFGVAITGIVQHTGAGFSSTAQFSVQNVNIEVSGTGGPTVSTTTGSLSPTVGYTYVVAYGNSASGQVSSTTPPSSLIKPVAQGVSIALVASTDPQVNQIWVFRTADGGSTYLNLPNSPFQNVTGNVTDDAPDSELNILEQAPINDANDPPPAASLDPVQYLGLAWVHVGNAVYYSRSGSAIVGSQYESFPPANVFTFPETVIRKIPINAGLLVLTVANIYIITGQNTSTSILTSQPFLAGYGILTWNAVWLDGSIIYFFTSDNRMIRLDPSAGVEDMGFPIADQLAFLNPAIVYVTYHSYTSNDSALYLGDGGSGWYRCNPNQAPDGQITGPVWSPKAIIVGGVAALASIQTSPGLHQLMLGGQGANEQVLVRDSSYGTFTDNGFAYAANCKIGSIVLAQPGQVAKMRFVTCEFMPAGSQPVISVLLDEIAGTFESISGYVTPDPPYLAASTSLYSNRYYFKQTIGSAAPPPALCRHLQIEVDFGDTDTVQNELLSMTINGAHFAER